MDDLISRQDVLDAIDKYILGKPEGDNVEVRELLKLITKVYRMPSAQPETAHKVKGKVKAGVTLWYSCDHCERPVDKYDAYCHCCGRRFVDE